MDLSKNGITILKSNFYNLKSFKVFIVPFFFLDLQNNTFLKNICISVAVTFLLN